MVKKFLLVSLIGLSVLSCGDDFDDKPVVPPVNKEPVNEDPKSDSENVNLHVKDFIWQGLNSYYLWQGDVKDLADKRFGDSIPDLKNAEYKKFLEGYDNPKTLFYNLLNNYGRIDRFSYITDDYTVLEEAFKGISLSSGMGYQLMAYDNNGVVAVVRYVLPNSGAEAAGIKRGDAFTKVDGELLNTSNYRSLLLSGKTQLTLEMAKIEVGENNRYKVINTGKTVTLTQTKLTENPILISKVIEKSGHKIGYLMYNSFVADFDLKLNEVFAKFKAEGVTDLVLDLRYNGGGRVSSAIYLSSMITGQFNKQLFSKEQWNSKLQPIREKIGGVENFFVDKIYNNTGTTSLANINSLGLTRLYVLTTGRTASASELVINGLRAYIEVIQIGGTTVGKNQASVTVYDYIGTGRSRVKNPSHKWAMQPLVLKMANAKGFSDYTSGLTPTIELKENLSNMGVLGEESEPFLAKAIERITGQTSRAYTRKTVAPSLEVIDDSKSGIFGYNEMYK
ncbi:S41 family peptidase [Capnocytophaga haemolytica]